MHVSNITTCVIQPFKAQWLIHVVHHSLTELWLTDTTVFIGLVYGFLEYAVFICTLLAFLSGAFTVSVILGHDAASTIDWYTTIRDSVVVSKRRWRGAKSQKNGDFSVCFPPTTLTNSDNWACLLRGTKLDFKFHSEKFKTVERTETNLTSADTDDDQFAVIIRPVHGLMNENTGRSLPSMSVLHSVDLLTPLIKTPTKSAEMWQRASVAVRHNQITDFTQGSIPRTQRVMRQPDTTKPADLPVLVVQYSNYLTCLLQHRAPQFFSSSCHWRQQCCTDNNLGIVDQSIGVIWGKAGKRGPNALNVYSTYEHFFGY